MSVPKMEVASSSSPPSSSKKNLAPKSSAMRKIFKDFLTQTLKKDSPKEEKIPAETLLESWKSYVEANDLGEEDCVTLAELMTEVNGMFPEYYTKAGSKEDTKKPKLPSELLHLHLPRDNLTRSRLWLILICTIVYLVIMVSSLNDRRRVAKPETGSFALMKDLQKLCGGLKNGTYGKQLKF